MAYISILASRHVAEDINQSLSSSEKWLKASSDLSGLHTAQIELRANSRSFGFESSKEHTAHNLNTNGLQTNTIPSTLSKLLSTAIEDGLLMSTGATRHSSAGAPKKNSTHQSSGSDVPTLACPRPPSSD
jgi:hypothetical protein